MIAQALLIVDDERPLLALLQRYLERRGHRVVTAGNGAEALEALHSQGPFDAVILDQGLPDTTGAALLPHFLESGSAVKVLIASGTPFAVESLPAEWRPRVGSLLKPFTPALLDEALAGLFGG